MTTVPSPAGIQPATAAAAPPDAKDLNVLCPPDKAMLFGSPPIVYTIPGDMPMDLYIMAQSALVNDDEVEATNLLHQSLKGVLGYYLNDEEAIAVLDRQVRKLGVRTILTLINSIYEDETPADDDGDVVVDPPVAETAVPPSASTTTTTSSSPEA